MRAFIAIPLDSECRAALQQQVAHLPTKLVDSIRWTPAENYHLTIKFLGEITEQQCLQIEASMQNWFEEGMSFFEADVLQLQAFPHPQKGPYIVASLDATILLQYLAREVDDQLKSVGFGKSKQAFRPHITLGKFQSEQAVQAFEPQLLEDIWLQVEQLQLMQSTLTTGASVFPQYKSLASHQLETYD